jgi:hypothetical protein
MLKHRGAIVSVVPRIKKIIKRFDGDTQKIRGELILDLKVLAELAHDQATKIKERGRPTKEHRNWARLAAYISQTINSIAKEYDLMKIKKKLEEIKRMVEKLERDHGKTT